MKIGFDAKRLFANTTGLGNYSRSLAENLQLLHPEHEYHLFTPKAKKTNRTELFFSKAFIIHESKALLKAYWRSISVVKDLKKNGIELYHGLSNELPYRLQDQGIKSVVSIHDLIFKVYPETYSLSERIIYDLKFKYACKHSDKIIAISESTKNDIVRFYHIEPSKIEVIYQTCNPIFYKLRSAQENAQTISDYNLPQKYFLYVGSVEQRKNLKLIIEAYSLHKKEIKTPLVIIGRGGKYKEECRSLIQSYGLEASFIWLENLKDNAHLQSVYQMAAALIYPSFYEGFGLPVAEALLSKTPVITADTSSLREAGGPDSIYIDPKNSTALSDAMIRIQSDKDLVTRMVDRGYEYAHRMFAPEPLTEQMMQCYLSVIKD